MNIAVMELFSQSLLYSFLIPLLKMELSWRFQVELVSLSVSFPPSHITVSTPVFLQNPELSLGGFFYHTEGREREKSNNTIDRWIGSNLIMKYWHSRKYKRTKKHHLPLGRKRFCLFY